MSYDCIIFADNLESYKKYINYVLKDESINILGITFDVDRNINLDVQGYTYIPFDEIEKYKYDYLICMTEESTNSSPKFKKLLPKKINALLAKFIKKVHAAKDLREWKKYKGWGSTIEEKRVLITKNKFYGGALATIPDQKIIPAKVFTINGFDFKPYIELKESGISFITDSCWGGITYHRLGLEFQTPFINMFIKKNDYIKLVNNLEYYLSLSLMPKCLVYASSICYPVVMLGDIELHFNHANTPKLLEMAIDKWYERKSKLSFDNIMVEAYFSAKEDIDLYYETFAQCPYPKIAFSPIAEEHEHIIYLKDYNIYKNTLYSEGFFSCGHDCARSNLPSGAPFNMIRTYNEKRIIY